MVRLLGKQLGDLEACPTPPPTCLRFDALTLLLRSFLTNWSTKHWALSIVLTLLRQYTLQYVSVTGWLCTHWGWWQRQILWQAGTRCNTKLNRPTSIQLGECSALWGKLEQVVWSNCVAQVKPFLPKCSLQCSPASVGVTQAHPNYVHITTHKMIYHWEASLSEHALLI